MSFNKAIFFDRDGTLIVHRPYLCDPNQVELIPGVREALHQALADGYLLFLFTNQSGVGRGYFSMHEVNRCNARMLELLQLPTPGFTEVCIAPEAPSATSVYRKPSPMFILEMAAKYKLDKQRTWMVGDAVSDLEAGLRAGIHVTIVNGPAAANLPEGVWHCAGVAEFYSRIQGTSK